jgi:oligopeptide transport system substrate-binding protein
MKKILLAAISIILLAGGAGCPLPGTGTSTSTQSQASGGSGNLNLYGSDPYTLDPALAGDSSSVEYIVQIFSGLVKLDDSLEPAPDIAQSWDIGDGGLTYTFYLRHDVYFQDGRTGNRR